MSTTEGHEHPQKRHLQELTLIRPDDWHLHVRDDKALAYTVPYTARQFGRAIIMPNLKPPVTTVASALDYRQRILAAVPHEHASFNPLMTLYLTESLSVDEIAAAAAHPHIHAAKLYPAGATTHSEAGVTDIEAISAVLEAMQKHDLPLLVHGEVVDNEVDVFDREAVFIERVLAPLRIRFPELRIVFEHITTADAVAFVRAHELTAATITAHHLFYSRNALFSGGIRPHHYCLPVLKREQHRQALIAAATSGAADFFLGTDSAPHARSGKESACGCAGIFTAAHALETYATIFEQAAALEQLEAFASLNGPAFYRLPVNTGQISLRRHPQPVAETLDYDNDVLVPFLAGDSLPWCLST